MQYGIRSPQGELLGDIAVHRLDDQPDTFELGVTLAPHAWGRGIATRVVRAMTAELVDIHRAHRVFAQCDARNSGMHGVLTRAGFRHEGTAVDADWFKGEWTSLETWAVLAREWPRD